MNNTFLGFTNLCESATLKNGTGGGSIPAVNQVSPYVMTNALNSDRYHLWRGESSGGQILFDLDLGANRTVTACAVLGHRLTDTSLPTTSIKVYSATAAAGYYPAGWTLQATLAGAGDPGRDFGSIISSVSARYWRFEWNTTGTGITVGKLWLGAPTDLGGAHSPGGGDTPGRAARLETPLPSGAIALRDLGDKGADFSLPFNTITSSVRSTIRSIADKSGSFLLIDPDGSFYEVYAPGGNAPTQRNSTSLYSAPLTLKRLP